MTTSTLLPPSTADLRPTDIKVRPYQREAIDAIRREYSGGVKSTLLVLPTGCGKTVTFGMIAREVALRGGRTLILAHRGELIEQASEMLFRLGMDVGIEKADSYARVLGDPHAVIATVQTMQGPRLASWPKDYFRLIITDEAHHATAESYRRVYRHFDARHLGVTATADRADEDEISAVFETLAYELSLWDAMTAPDPGPYLSRVKFVQCDVGIDLRDIRTTAGDLNQADLEEAIRPHIDALANAIRQEVGQRKTLVFTPDVGSATAMASALSAVGVPASWVSGDDAGRKDKVRDFKKGHFQALCNCALLTEGFDCPDIEAIVLCRPTKSRPLYAQMVGRGTRLSPGKTDCLLVDFAWITEKHQLVKPIELFDGSRIDSEVLDIAQAELEKNPHSDLTEVIERSREEQVKRVALRIQARERAVKYRKVTYDPLAVMETLGVPVRREAKTHEGTATEKQMSALRRFKVEGVEGLSKRRAKAMLDQLIERSRLNLATYKQVSWLVKFGVSPDEARKMSFKDASAALDQYFNRGK